MAEPNMVDTLVRLAAFGASGVCVLVVFWVGFILLRQTKKRDAEWHKTIRFYMGACVACALVSMTSGIANAMFNMDRVDHERDRNRNITKELRVTRSALDELETAARQLNDAGALATIDPRRYGREVRSALTVIKDVSANPIARELAIPAQPSASEATQ